MSDMPSSNTAQPAGRGITRAVKLTLAASLALNVAVAGIFFGAWIRHSQPERPPHAVARDFGFGPFSDALTKSQRRALARDFTQKNGSPKQMRAEISQEFAAILAALKTTPFDAMALNAAMARQHNSFTRRLEQGKAAMQDMILSMSDDERAAFAEKLALSLAQAEQKAPRPPKP